MGPAQRDAVVFKSAADFQTLLPKPTPTSRPVLEHPSELRSSFRPQRNSFSIFDPAIFDRVFRDQPVAMRCFAK